MTGEQVEPVGYGPLLDAVKKEIAGARLRAARAINTELIEMYWRIDAWSLTGRPTRAGAPGSSTASPPTCAPPFPAPRA